MPQQRFLSIQHPKWSLKNWSDHLTLQLKLLSISKQNPKPLLWTCKPIVGTQQIPRMKGWNNMTYSPYKHSLSSPKLNFKAKIKVVIMVVYGEEFCLHRTEVSIWLTNSQSSFWLKPIWLDMAMAAWGRRKIPNWIFSVRGRLIWHKGFTLSLLPPSFMWHWRAMNSDAQVMIQSIHMKFLMNLYHMYLSSNSYGYQLFCTHLICYH